MKAMFCCEVICSARRKTVEWSMGRPLPTPLLPFPTWALGQLNSSSSTAPQPPDGPAAHLRSSSKPLSTSLTPFSRSRLAHSTKRAEQMREESEGGLEGPMGDLRESVSASSGERGREAKTWGLEGLKGARVELEGLTERGLRGARGWEGGSGGLGRLGAEELDEWLAAGRRLGLRRLQEALEAAFLGRLSAGEAGEEWLGLALRLLGEGALSAKASEALGGLLCAKWPGRLRQGWQGLRLPAVLALLAQPRLAPPLQRLGLGLGWLAAEAEATREGAWEGIGEEGAGTGEERLAEELVLGALPWAELSEEDAAEAEETLGRAFAERLLPSSLQRKVWERLGLRGLGDLLPQPRPLLPFAPPASLPLSQGSSSGELLASLQHSLPSSFSQPLPHHSSNTPSLS